MSELHDEWCAQRVARFLAKRGYAPPASDEADDAEVTAEVEVDEEAE